MKRFFLHIILLVLTLTASAQNLSVLSFNELPNDLDAKTHYPKLFSQTNAKCAIIKVVNTHTGFTFDVGSLPVVATQVQSEMGETWVYVPEGTKKIKIAHPQLGQLATDDGYYWFPMPIRSACCYRLVLTSGKIKVEIEEEKKQTGWLIIKSNPSDADVYLTQNGVESLVGNTSNFQQKMAYGDYRYRVSKPLYHDEVGRVQVNQPRVEIVPTLAPAHGNINITSTPAGAKVEIEGQRETYTTPCTTDIMASGNYTLRLSKEKYNRTQQQVTVEDGKTATIHVNLSANYARITVNTLPQAEILLNGRKVATESYSEELMPGIYDLEARLANHKTASRQIEVEANKPQTITLNPTPIYGSLDVITTPMDATITINGKRYGVSPTTIENLHIGTYTVELSKTGYATETATVTIEDGKTSIVNRTLSSGREKETVSERIPSNQNRLDDKQSSELTFTVKGVQFKMVRVEGGTFTMGATAEQGSDADSDENPTHQVTLSTYYIGQTEVTQALWEAVMGKCVTQIAKENNWKTYGVGPNYPMYDISWNDCQEFIQKLNQLTGKTFRLPTEAEWEYAARGRKKSKGYKYAGSNNIDAVAWYDEDSGSTHPVATKAANELGIYDMSGNVCEWCQDWFGGYSSSSQTNPQGPNSGSYRVHRGGSWSYDARFCRVSNRGGGKPAFRNYYLGLRLVLEISESDDNSNEGFVVDEEEATFPGGLEALYEYVYSHIKYPSAARENNIEGKVYVSFTVEADGSVSNVKVLKDIGEGCGDEVKRVVETLPRWNPAKQRGKPVRSSFNLPVNFQLQ